MFNQVVEEGEAQRRPVHLEVEVFDLMTMWIERHRRRAEERYQRLDDLLAAMHDDIEPVPPAEAGPSPTGEPR